MGHNGKRRPTLNERAATVKKTVPDFQETGNVPI
jgi:hypothetical protein